MVFCNASLNSPRAILQCSSCRGGCPNSPPGSGHLFCRQIPYFHPSPPRIIFRLRNSVCNSHSFLSLLQRYLVCWGSKWGSVNPFIHYTHYCKMTHRL